MQYFLGIHLGCNTSEASILDSIISWNPSWIQYFPGIHLGFNTSLVSILDSILPWYPSWIQYFPGIHVANIVATPIFVNLSIPWYIKQKLRKMIETCIVIDLKRLYLSMLFLLIRLFNLNYAVNLCGDRSFTVLTNRLKIVPFNLGSINKSWFDSYACVTVWYLEPGLIACLRATLVFLCGI